jgi:hypothetical protein
MGMDGPEIALGRIPAPRAGASVPRIRKATLQTVPVFRGAFRTTCELSHMNFDDVMVAPGVKGAFHLHQYVGNTAADADAQFEEGRIAEVGDSTCRGGTVNRTAYWSPAMVDTRTGTPVVPDGFMAYYKHGYDLPVGTQFVVPPVGLRMLSGSMSNTSPNGPWRFNCNGLNGAVNYDTRGIPTQCPMGATITANIAFPQCWDGVNLDSPTHRTHVVSVVSDGAGGRRCPASHPHALPKVEFNWRYRVVDPEALKYWRLSSDMNPAVPAGYTFHGDWWNGWRPDVMARWVNNCLNLARDCHSELLGDGETLY